jgi:hypothetical protein
MVKPFNGIRQGSAEIRKDAERKIRRYRRRKTKGEESGLKTHFGTLINTNTPINPNHKGT